MKICVLIELVCEKQQFLAQMQLRLISFALFKLSERNRIVQMHNAAISFTLLLFAAPLCLFLYLLAFYFCPFLHIAQQLKLIYAVETERPAPGTVKCTSPAVIYLLVESPADTRLSFSPSHMLTLSFSHTHT